MRFLPLALALVTLAGPVRAQRYELVWSDEFDTLDKATWTFWRGTAYNNELQYYTSRDTNVAVRDGLLYLWAQRESYGGRQYTSARMESKGHADFRYGRFEARARLPTPVSYGLWPALWLMPTRSVYGGWPRSGEIDIMEWRSDLPRRLYGTAHFARGGVHAGNGATFDAPAPLSDDFHLYAIEWDTTGIRWFLDDREFHRITRKDLGAEPYPFDQSFFWILNVAVGGDFLPNPPAGAQFRQAMVVDYVRVYQDANAAPQAALPALPDTVAVGVPLSVEVAASDPDGTVAGVALTADGVAVDSTALPPYRLRWTPPVAGCYTLGARVYDNDGRRSVVAGPRVVAGAGCTRAPFEGVPHAVPGRIAAAAFDRGGPGVGYFDSTLVAVGGDFRPDDGVEVRAEGSGYVVTDTRAGEWLSYSIYVAEAGAYDLTVRARPPAGSDRLVFEVDGDFVGQMLRFPGDGSAFAERTLAGVELGAGPHVLRLTVATPGFELDQLTFSRTATAAEPGAVPPVFVTRPPAPNPTRGALALTVAVETPQPVGVRVVDVLGRTVALLAEGWQQAGEHLLETHLAVAPGTYFVVVDTGAGRAAWPIVVLP